MAARLVSSRKITVGSGCVLAAANSNEKQVERKNPCLRVAFLIDII